MPRWAQSDDILEVLGEMLEIASLVLVEDYQIHLNAALSQEVVREQEVLSNASLSGVVDLNEHDRKIS